MIVSETESLCPECLALVPAAYVEDKAEPGLVLLEKRCPEHGVFRTRVWKGAPAFTEWRRPKIPSYPRMPYTEKDKGCPYDCGLCPEHGQHTCTGLIEVTERCNLQCPVCYAEAGTGADTDPDLDNLRFRFQRLWQASGACNIQLSGGEPTMRNDLPEIIRAAREQGFPFIQLNTNGLRLALEPGYAAALAKAGLDSVYLQFDGPDDEVFQVIRGRPLLKDKLAAIRACEDAGLGVVMVATLVRNINLEKLGNLLRLALELGPVIRGLHMQPAASFGRFPWEQAGAVPVTLPEVMAALAEQGQGLVRLEDFHPPGCEHSLCSFSAVYRRVPGPGLQPASGASSCCTPKSASPIVAAEGAARAKAFTARHWTSPPRTAMPLSEEPGKENAALMDDFDRFLAQAGLNQRFTLSAMAFQDANTLDLERVRGCCIHVVNRKGLLIPFCMYNLTARDGTALYRRQD